MVWCLSGWVVVCLSGCVVEWLCGWVVEWLWSMTEWLSNCVVK